RRVSLSTTIRGGLLRSWRPIWTHCRQYNKDQRKPEEPLDLRAAPLIPLFFQSGIAQLGEDHFHRQLFRQQLLKLDRFALPGGTESLQLPRDFSFPLPDVLVKGLVFFQLCHFSSTSKRCKKVSTSSRLEYQPVTKRMPVRPSR